MRVPPSALGLRHSEGKLAHFMGHGVNMDDNLLNL